MSNSKSAKLQKDMPAYEPKFTQPSNGTISGTAIGIAAAMAAQKINSAEAIRNKTKKTERDAKLIAETLLDAMLPETTEAIERYLTNYVNDEAVYDESLCKVITNLYADDAESVQADRIAAVNQIIEEDPHGVTPLCKVHAAGDVFVATAKEWAAQINRHKIMAAKQTVKNDYKTLCEKAKEGLVDHGIIDEEGNLTDEYCNSFKKPAREVSEPVYDVEKEYELEEIADKYDDFSEDVAGYDIDEPNIVETVEDGVFESDETVAFIPGFTGITTDDPYAGDYLDEPTDVTEEDLDIAGEELVETLDTSIPKVIAETVEPEVEDEAGTMLSDPLNEIDAENPSLTVDLGEAATAIAEMSEEKDIEEIDDELIVEAINETAEEMDEEIKEALANVDKLPDVEDIKELIVESVKADKQLVEGETENLEELTIVDTDEVSGTADEPELDKNEALMFTQSFMAVSPGTKDLDEEQSKQGSGENVIAELEKSAEERRKKFEEAAGDIVSDDD